MRCVFTSNIAQAAVDTFILVNFCNMVIVNIKVFPVGNGVYTFANKIIQSFKSFFIHPVVQAFYHIFHNSKTMFHSSRAYLYIAGTEQRKLYSIFPCTYAPIPLIGTLLVISSCAIVVSILSAMGFTAGPQYPPNTLLPAT